MSYDLAELLVNLTDKAVFSGGWAGWVTAGHVPAIPDVDVAHALGKIKNRNAALFLRIKYAHTHNPSDEAQNGLYKELIRQLDRAMWLEVCDLWNEKKWPRPIGKMQLYRRAMGQLALAENIWPGQCMSCGGTKIEAKDSKIVECTSCGGRGKVSFNEKYRADLLGIPKEAWEQWQGRYRKIQSIPRQWESDGLRELRKALSMWPYGE